jgi:hypothetical protein
MQPAVMDCFTVFAMTLSRVEGNGKFLAENVSHFLPARKSANCRKIHRLQSGVAAGVDT